MKAWLITGANRGLGRAFAQADIAVAATQVQHG